ncbi:hypothetical protein HAX54_037929, partial [Datura stramonium]|nr:hypothetical protein [Datura stramonium]
GLVLTDSWEKVQHDDEEVIQNMDFSMGECSPALQNFHHEAKLDHTEQNQKVELIEIGSQRVEANLNNVTMETYNVQHQLVVGGNFESSPYEDEGKMDFEDLRAIC